MARIITLMAAVALAACGTSGGDSNVLEIKTKAITIDPGKEVLYCYYLHTPNEKPALVTKWTSHLGQGGHHAIVFVNPSGMQPADNTYEANCGLVGTSEPIWTYATQTQDDEWDLPADDGNGKPIAQLIAPHTAIYIQLHLLNATDAPLSVSLDIKGEEIPANTDYTQTAAYVSYNNSFSIPPHAMNYTVQAGCPVPPGAKFVSLTTHAHKQSIQNQVLDGTNTIYQSTDWEHPINKFWSSSPFYTFTDPNLTYSCTYNNTGDNANNTIYQGPSALTNEMCMVAGFYFPATGPTFCVWDTSIPGNCGCTTLTSG